jgi:hypothetical protein
MREARGPGTWIAASGALVVALGWIIPAVFGVELPSTWSLVVSAGGAVLALIGFMMSRADDGVDQSVVAHRASLRALERSARTVHRFVAADRRRERLAMVGRAQSTGGEAKRLIRYS